MNGFWERKFIWDILIALSILVLPFGLYVHLIFDTETTFIVFFGYQYDHGYNGIGPFIWHVLAMLVPILLMLIWYFNYHYIFRYFILIPVLLFEFQLIRYVFKYPFYIENNIGLFVVCVLVFSLTIIQLFDSLFMKKNEKSLRFNFKNIFKYDLKHKVNLFEGQRTFTKTVSNTIGIKQMYLSKILLADTIATSISLGGHRLKKKLFYLFAFILLMLPFLFFSYYLIPENIQEYRNDWIHIDSYGYLDLFTFVWFINLKLCILIPLCIWFVTSAAWWKYAILSPIIVFTYQLWESVQETEFVDVMSFGKVLPWVVVLVVFLFYVSSKIKNQSRILDLYIEISNEIDRLIVQLEDTEGSNNNVKHYFEALNKNIAKGKSKDQLDELIQLRNKLNWELDQK